MSLENGDGIVNVEGIYLQKLSDTAMIHVLDRKQSTVVEEFGMN